VTLTPSDTYQSLSRGLAQGIHSSWAAVEVFKLEEVTRYHMEVAWGLAPGYIAMNKAVYAKLPDAVRRAVDLASYEKFSVTLGDSMDAQNNDVRKRVSALAGHTVYQLDAAETAVWKAKLAPIVEDWVKATPNGAAILAAFRAELAKIRSGT
jgi:TRAP-type C4-dicarboxylate transport system substrate-binding protein